MEKGTWREEGWPRQGTNYVKHFLYTHIMRTCGMVLLFFNRICMITLNVAYNVSKVGVIALTRVLARRVISEGKDILVNSCHPGWVRTDMAGPAALLSPGMRSARNSVFNGWGL